MKILRFEPLLKQTIWGGDKIAQMKHLAGAPELVGESWELSAVPGDETVCPDLEGLSLTQLVARHSEQLVGRHVYEQYGDTFPLLIKFIDARQNLSIQVHPDDATARRQGKARGKTEMWYLLDSAPDAFLYCGLKQPVTPRQYKQMVEDDTICDALARYPVSQGDVFFIPAGRIHAIGAGCLLAEIQQTSDVTYRIYDYKRRDKDGNLRQLHTREAMESIDFTVYPDYRSHYTYEKDRGAELVACRYFTTTLYDLSHSVQIDQRRLDSFVVLMGLSGDLTVATDSDATTLHAFQTLLVAAENGHIEVTGEGRFLEIHID